MKTNKKTKGSNHLMSAERTAGGAGTRAAKSSNETTLRRLVMSCLLWEKNAYIDGKSVVDEICKLVPNLDAFTCSSIAIDARIKQKLRHVPLLLLREMCKYPAHRVFVRQAMRMICTRPDQLTELVNLYWADGKKPLPAQIKRGIADCLSSYDAYQLAKYNRKDVVSLKDLVRLTHPNKNAELLGALMNGTLPVPDTWEVGISAASSKTEKAEVWKALANANKLPALAALKNLRNMSEVLPAKDVKSILKKVKSSFLLPMDFMKAAVHSTGFESELEGMMLKCLGDIPKLSGETIIVVDVSGSMGQKSSARSEFSWLDCAASMAIIAREVCEDATIYATAGSDSLSKHATVKLKSYRGFGLVNEIMAAKSSLGGGGIFTRQCLDFIKKEEKSTPERIIVISDSQDMDRHDKVPNPFGKRNYLVNIAAHKNGINYAGKWTAEVSGWSEHFLHYIAALESDE